MFEFTKKFYIVFIVLLVLINLISLYITRFEVYYFIGILIFGVFASFTNILEFSVFNKRKISTRSKLVFYGLCFFVVVLFINICMSQPKDHSAGIQVCASSILIVDLLTYKIMDIQEY